EIAEVVAASKPHEVLLVVDAMAVQDAVESATAFHARLPLTGLVLAKADGDARGGASLSVRAVTGVPVKLIGTGEKLDAIEVFHPDRLAQRILGMGDILTLVERAQETVDQQTAEAQARKLLDASFTFDDFYAQLQQLKKMGPLGDILKMIPGLGGAAKQLPEGPEAARELRRIEAIISSMTRAERSDPTSIHCWRRRRTAAAAGTTGSHRHPRRGGRGPAGRRGRPRRGRGPAGRGQARAAARHWIKSGARPTATARSLLVRSGIPDNEVPKAAR